MALERTGHFDLSAESVAAMAARGAYDAPTGRSYLSLAILDGNRPLFDALLAAGADVDALDRAPEEECETRYEGIQGNSPLHTAFRCLKPGPGNPEWVDNDGVGTIVHTRFDPYYAEALLGAGAKPDIVNDQGFTPLIYAVLYGHHEWVEPLLEAGADPNRLVGDYQKSLIAMAASSYVEQGSREMVRTLIDGGADALIREYHTNPMLSIADFRDDQPRDFRSINYEEYKRLLESTQAMMYDFTKRPAAYARLHFVTESGKATVAFNRALAFGYLPDILKSDCADDPALIVALWSAAGPHYQQKYRDVIDMAPVYRAANEQVEGTEAAWAKRTGQRQARERQ